MAHLALPLAACLSLVLAGLGCSTGGGGGGDARHQPATLEITPADATLDVVNGDAAQQVYTATRVRADGTREDVTGQVTFAVAATGFGSFTGATLTATGAAIGVTEIRAGVGELLASARLTVRVRGVRFDPLTPLYAPSLFRTATEDVARAPVLVYPDDRVLVPPNLGELDVHWRDLADNDLFEVTLTNAYADIRIYTKVSNLSWWAIYRPDEWSPVARARAPMTFTVAGLQLAAPMTKGTSAPRTIDVTNEDQGGGVYFWATNGSGILRYDVETPDTPPARLFPDDIPTGCVGCHALSRDGNRIALTFETTNAGRGGVMDLASDTFVLPYDRGVRWTFTTFNPTGSELIAVLNGQMTVYAADGGAVLATVPDVTWAVHPELSPDGTRLAYVEATSRLGGDQSVLDGGVVVRDYDEATHTFGPPHTLVPFEAPLGSYYPSWSPDGQWLAITRNIGRSNDNATSQLWVVKADGTAPPIALTLANQGANLTNSWARWVPLALTFGPDAEPVYFLTFSSKRAFGSRRNTPGLTQIWMAPFFPARAAAGLDPSGLAVRLPFQSLHYANHIAQWTQRVVIP